MNGQKNDVCCPRFDPEPWDDAALAWEGKRFMKEHVVSFLHIPLNFGSVMKGAMAAIEAAGAASGNRVVLTDENSLWGADVYLEVAGDVPGASMATISGTFLSKVFEGPYSSMRTWIEAMKVSVRGKGKDIRKLFFFYTTCPKCAKK